ncbi:MAG: TonB family protein [Rhodovibrionaceae bacterium]
MMQIGRRHWSIALIGAALLHAAVAAVVLWQAPVVGARGSGIGGIEVSLGPTGGAPGSAASAVEEIAEAETREPAEAQTTLPPEEAAAQQTQTKQVTEAEAQETAAREPREVVAQAPEPETAEAVEVPEVEVVELETAEQPREVEEVQAVVQPEALEAEARPAPPLPQVRPADLPKPVAEQQPELQPEPVEQAKSSLPSEKPQQQTAKLPPSSAGAGGKAGSEDSSEAGSASDSSGGGNPGEVADYMARLQAWLERHKEYPRHARQRRQEGTVLLFFVMDRNGRVLDYRLKQSSGYDLLDHAVEEMIQRAQPLPRMPEEMRQARLELIVPVQFFLR